MVDAAAVVEAAVDEGTAAVEEEVTKVVEEEEELELELELVVEEDLVDEEDEEEEEAEVEVDDALVVVEAEPVTPEIEKRGE